MYIDVLFAGFVTGLTLCSLQVQFGDHQGVAQLHCGVHFSLILTKDGSVYTWLAAGKNKNNGGR